MSNLKKSQLCIGLDLHKDPIDRLNEALKIVDETHNFAIAYKPNRQYWLGSSIEDLQELNDRIHKYGCVSICDHKLSDIESSNYLALKTISEEKFDYVTVSPFPGNLRETKENANEMNLGIITLLLMSNPGSKWIIDNNLLISFAREANLYSDGVVIGTTNHVTREILEDLSKYVKNPFILAPGIGKQRGIIDSLIDVFGERVIFNVSRSISLSNDYKKSALKFKNKINSIKRSS